MGSWGRRSWRRHTDGEEKDREGKLKCRQDRGGLWTSTWEPEFYRNSLVARDLDACALGQCFCTNENPPYTLAPRKRSATKFPTEAHPINSSASLPFHPHHRFPYNKMRSVIKARGRRHGPVELFRIICGDRCLRRTGECGVDGSLLDM